MPPARVAPLRQPRFLHVRPSPAHGLGVFTTRAIPAGTRLLEYLGERISHAEAARRYYAAADPDAFVLLFEVDRSVVIDGGAGGRAARYVNHSCEPNCETFLQDRRIFIESIRPIPAGGELTYDYRMERPSPLPRDWRHRYACRCGAPGCRGTMLVPARSGSQRRAPAVARRQLDSAREVS